MTENGYTHMQPLNSRGSKKEYKKNRESEFDDEEDNNSNIVESVQQPYSKINTFNVSSSTGESTKNGNKESSSEKTLILNELICIINILSSTLGGGAFVFPHILYQIGIITSLIIFIFVSLSVYFSFDLLRRFVVDSKYLSFSIIVQMTLGHLWLKIYVVCSFLFYMSCIVNYLDLLYKYIKSLVSFFEEGWGKYLFFFISCCIEIVLSLFTNKISRLHFLSLIAISCYFIIIIVLITKSIISFYNGDFQGFSLFTIEDKFIKESTSWHKFLIIMAKIIEFFYGFICHSSFPTLLSGLDNISSRNTKKIQDISFTALFFIYIIFSFFGCSFYEEKSDLLFENNIDISNSVLKALFKIILILLFVTLIPIRYLVIRDNYTSLIGQETLPLKYEIIITSGCLFVNNLIVCFTGNSNNFISQLIHYFGGALGVFICFILPIISYIAINSKIKKRAIVGYIISGVFIVIGFFSIFYNFQAKNDGITN